MRIFKNKTVRKNCKIYAMLSQNAKKRHLSFHTPGHKHGKWDITELSFSDNLSCPNGCLQEAEQEIAQILRAKKSFLLTDGSTSGILSMLYTAKTRGVKTVLFCEASHKSVYNGCALLGLTAWTYPQKTQKTIPCSYTWEEFYEKFSVTLEETDAILLTSPDYYGNVPPLKEISAYCRARNKLLLVDGAHGGHLHFDTNLYAGAWADLWVDGVHKSLPSFTQGAIVSARTEELAETLRNAVDIFRTTSPSYPIMASIEYAVKYPRNLCLERAVSGFVKTQPRVFIKQDWTKFCAVFGANAFEAEKALVSRGIYPEFCDGNIIMFYLSPATSNRTFSKLKRELKRLFEIFPYIEKKEEKSVQRNPAPVVFDKNAKTEWVKTELCVNRVCAQTCGMFPPCTPLIQAGERVEEDKIELMKKADNVYGLKDGKMLVYEETEV